MYFLLLDLQDSTPTLSDQRALHYAYFMKGALSLIADRNGMGGNDITIVPLLLDKTFNNINGDEVVSELNMQFCRLDCLKLIDNGGKKSATIATVFSTLSNEYPGTRFSIVCHSSNEFHFKSALQSTNAAVDHLVPIAPVNTVKTDLKSLVSIQKLVYSGLVEKVIGSADSEITGLLAAAKLHLLFYTLKKNKKIDLDCQCETNEIGIHLQYSIARIEGIKSGLEKEGIEMEKFQTANVGKADLDTLFEQFPKAYTLYKLISSFDEKLQKSVQEPSVLVAFASLLSKLVSSLYYHLRIKGEEFCTQRVRWHLFELSLKTLQMILTLFHVDPIKQI